MPPDLGFPSAAPPSRPRLGQPPYPAGLFPAAPIPAPLRGGRRTGE